MQNQQLKKTITKVLHQLSVIISEMITYLDYTEHVKAQEQNTPLSRVKENIKGQGTGGFLKAPWIKCSARG